MIGLADGNEGGGVQTCEMCDGAKVIHTIKVLNITCPLCDGSGSLSDERRRRLAIGLKYRAYRENSGLGLREAALRWGMKPSELSQIEQGKSENLSWRPPGYAEYNA